MRSTIRVFVAILALGAGLAVHAQTTRYVTDEFTINLRSGAGNQYRILELVETGTRLQVIETSGDWSRVRAASGRAGWVRTQYLSSQPAAADRLAAAEKEMRTARSRARQLEKQLNSVQGELETSRNRIRELTGSRDELTRKLDSARNGLELSDENKRLKKQVIDLQRGIQDLENETERLSDRSRQDWFMVGSGVTVLGILIGIIVTRIRWRRRSSWSQL